MKACSSASGGVMFVPDEIDQKTRTISYSEFVEKEDATAKVGVFGKKKASKTSVGKGDIQAA